MSGNVRGLLLSGRQQIYQPQLFSSYLTKEGSVIAAKWLNLLAKYFPMNSTGKLLTHDSFRRKRLSGLSYSQQEVQEFLGDYQNYLQTALSRVERDKIKSIFSQSQTITQKQAIPVFLPKFAQRQAVLSVANERRQHQVRAIGIVRLIGQFTDIDTIKWFIWKQVYDHKLRIQMLGLPPAYQAIVQQIVGDSMIFAGIGQMNQRWREQEYPLTITGRRIVRPMYYGQAQLQVDYNFTQSVYINFDQEQIGDQCLKALRTIIFVYMFYKTMPTVLVAQSELKLGEQVLQMFTQSGIINMRNIWRLSIYVKVSETKTIIPVNFQINPRTLRQDMTGQQIFAQIYVTFARRLLKQYWKSLRNVYNEQTALQRYLQVDQQGQFMSYLKIEGFRIVGRVIAFDTTKQMNWAHGDEQVVQIVQAIIKSTTQLPPITSARNMMNWQVYAVPKRGQMNDFQIKPIQGKPCLLQFNALVQSQGYPQLILTGDDDLQQIYTYCCHQGFGMKMLGQQQPQVWPQDKNAFWVLVYPRHIQLSRTSIMKQKRQTTNIATYSQNKNQKIRGDNRSLSRPTVQKWKIGLQLPLDSSLDTKTQVALRRKCIVIDIESLSIEGQRQTPYMICAVGYLDSDGTPFYRAWTNLQIYQPKGQTVVVGNQIQASICLKNFVSWLALIVHMYNHEDPLMIWGYNMMGYQITYLLLQLQRQFGKVQMQGPPNECKSFSVGQRRIVFADVLKILSPQTLESACADFQIIIKKKASTNIALVKTWEQVTHRYSQIMEYCFYDCVSTLLLLHKLHCGFVSIADKIQMHYDLKDITHRLTASGLGWDFFIQGFLKKSIKLGQKDWTQKIIYNLQPQEVYDHQRQSFVGGVVQVFKYLWQNKVFVVDINSMYPAMLRNPLPWKYQGEYQFQSLQQIMNQKDSDMYLFEVYRYLLPIDFKGAFVATKQLNTTKNTYYNSYADENKPIYLRGVIIRRILHHKGQIFCKKCWKYSNGEIIAFKQFAEVFYRQRQLVQLQSLKVCYKLLMNSVIGRCSMGIKEKYSLSCAPRTNNFTTVSDQIYLDVQDPQLPPVGRLVRITAYVTDMARVYLDQLADLAGYDNVCYCDTDSLMVTQKGYENLGSPGAKATVLGQFKCQAPQKGKAMTKYYNKGYFKNRKDYILEYTSKQGEIRYLYKAKGIPKKFITKTFTQTMIKSFLGILPQLMYQPAQHTRTVGDYVRMQVWRREYKKEGVTIKEMLKKSSVIVDRFFIKPQETGICRPGSGYVMQIEDHFG